MSKKSKFLPPLLTRDGLNYPNPGTWIRNVSFNKLAILARNLDTSRAKDRPDKLHSVPTPWARLLLFETALYDKSHPAHAEVRSQWRGLLGLVGLANVLNLGGKLKSVPFDLGAQHVGDLRNAFRELRPRHMSGERDLEQDKWDSFGLIFLDQALLGGTSPRTLVFTGISHECPPSVPFRTPQGRLADPTEHFRRNDPVFLDVLRQWIEQLKGIISRDAHLIEWLGQNPSDVNAQPESRYEKLVGALEDWLTDIGAAAEGVKLVLSANSNLPFPYNFIRHVEEADIPRRSDLFFDGRDDLILGYRPGDSQGSGSQLVDAHDNRLTGLPVTLWPGHQVAAGQALPRNLKDFIPADVHIVRDPAEELFEDSLIEVEVFDPKAISCLTLDGKTYLLPFRSEVVRLFSEAELARVVRQTAIRRLDSATIRVEAKFPLGSGWNVKAFRDYRHDEQVVDSARHATQYLAMWPDFVCEGRDDAERPYFGHYFYYTSPGGIDQVEFVPLPEDLIQRGIPEQGRTWYMSAEPLRGFVGSVGDRRGLLLINNRPVTRPARYWKVGVDFGSTHTTVFYREVERGDGDGWVDVRDRQIMPLVVEPRVRILTRGDAFEIQENFFPYRTAAQPRPGGEPAGEAALTTQLSMPLGYAEYHANDWLPREGLVFLGSLLDSAPANIETDLKWNIDRNNHTASAFLRSLLIMVEAEAVSRGARIARVAHAFPTAFPDELEIKHSEEWAAVSRCVGVPVDEEPISEAVATCRHLWREQQGMPTANIIALDVGGSTTDIAIWFDETLQGQESVKIAAGAASRYVESPAAAGFRQWLLKKLGEDEPFKTQRFFPANYPANELNRRKYHAALKRLSEYRQMESFVKHVQVSARNNQNVRQFLSPVVLIFGVISYFAGLLTRKTGYGENEKYYLYFCGRGGQLLLWIPDGREFAQEMFEAGVVGPHTATSAKSAARVSRFPKEEVGRGLLTEGQFQADAGGGGGGMFDEAGETVTVGEQGYGHLVWHGNLGYDELLFAKDNVPPQERMTFFKHFVQVFSSSLRTRDIAAKLRLTEHFNSVDFRDVLRQRLADNLRGGAARALKESLFITEAKSLIELVAGQRDLFE